MAIKTFTTGEVLTASDTNTYLANSGLVYVKSQTIGSGVSSVTVNDAFSTTYDNYVITVSGGTTPSNTTLSFLCANQASGYRYSYLYTAFAGTALAVGGVSYTAIEYVGFANTTGINAIISVSNPFLASPTMVTADGGSLGNFAGHVTAIEPSNTSFTSFTVFPTAGTITGGTITVYGYRKA